MTGQYVLSTYNDSTYDGSGIPLYANTEGNCGGCTLIEAGFLYDNYGRQNQFTFDLANGAYNVTISVGWPNKAYSDPHQVLVNGQWLINNEPTTNYTSTNYIIKRSVIVNVTTGNLIILFGGNSPGVGYSYTFLQYANIEPI